MMFYQLRIIIHNDNRHIIVIYAYIHINAGTSSIFQFSASFIDHNNNQFFMAAWPQKIELH